MKLFRSIVLTLSLAATLVGGMTACKRAGPGGAPGAGGPGGQTPPMPVVAVEAKRQPITESLSLVGSLAANEMVEIKSEVDGTIEQIPFKEGQRVQPGDLLVQLDESKLAAAVNEAEANARLSEANYERLKKLLDQKMISPQEFDQTASAFAANKASLDLKRRMLKDARLRAPFGGVVGARHVSPGQVISKSTLLTTLVDMDVVKAEFYVPERFLSQTRPGQTIELRVAAFPGEKMKGEVYFVAPQVDPDTRTALVKAYLKNPEHRLRPGMFANLDLNLQIKPNAVVIPEAALVLSGDRANVFVVDQAQTAQVRPVRAGLRMAGSVEIAEGLNPGELVIVEGFQKTQPGGKVIVRRPEGEPPLTGPAAARVSPGTNAAAKPN